MPIELPIELPIGLPIELPIGLPIELPIELPIVLPIELPIVLPIVLRQQPGPGPAGSWAGPAYTINTLDSDKDVSINTFSTNDFFMMLI